MFKIYALGLFFALYFSGCATLTPSVSEKSGDDFAVLKALDAQREQDFSLASILFYELYKKTNNKEYLYQSIKNDITTSKNKEAIAKVDEHMQSGSYDFELARLKTVAFMNLFELNSAKEVALELSSKSNIGDDYVLLADIYLKQKDNQNALDALKKAYDIDHKEEVVDSMSVMMYASMDLKKEAISVLESHSRIYGCSSLICNRLIGFYSDQNNANVRLQKFLSLYKLELSEEIAKKIISLYIYTRDFKSLEEFLLTSKVDDEILLSLYAQDERYNEAKTLADELYAKTHRVEFLAQSAIFEFEGAKDKKNKELLSRVVANLEEVLKSARSPMHLNYLGYVLIDNDVDVLRGVELVKEALKSEPDSLYYLDSLAWGYYKLKRCKEAKEAIDRAIELGGDEHDEVMLHKKAIDKCIKGKK